MLALLCSVYLALPFSLSTYMNIYIHIYIYIYILLSVYIYIFNVMCRDKEIGIFAGNTFVFALTSCYRECTILILPPLLKLHAKQ